MKLPDLDWKNWPLTFKGGAIIMTSLAMLLGSVASSYTLERQTAVATAEMLRTLEVQRDIQLLHTLIAEAATGVRGYLLTGMDDFLNPYRNAQAQLPSAMASLQRNIRDPEQRERLRQLLPLAQQKLAGLEALRRQYHAQGGDLRASLLSGREILNRLRNIIAAMNVRESLLIEQRTSAVHAALRRNMLMNVATILVGLAGASAMFLFTVGVVRRVRLAADNAERLVRDQPLLPTGVASDELGQLADRLHSTSLLLANRAAAAQAASVAKTEFLSRTNHELRTPLNAILGFAQLLETDLAGTPAQQQVAHIIGAGRHLLSLIDDVLDVARIEAGQLAIASVPVLVTPVLMEALALLQPLASRHKVRLPAPRNCDGLVVLADRQRLMQVVLNVVSNAIKYNSEHGQVRITASVQDELLAIVIADDGAGISADMQGRLFTPFDRLGAERGKTEGVGLGLAVTRSLVEAMGGSIVSASEPGKGSTFTIRLPRSTQPAHGPGPYHARAIGATSEQPAPAHAVLCIDSDASSLALVETLMMRRRTWRLITAPTTAEGLRLARHDPPDVLLLAWHMADQLTLEQLRSDARLAQIPLVIMGPDTNPRTGAAGHLKKPLDVPEFFCLLDRIIR